MPTRCLATQVPMMSSFQQQQREDTVEVTAKTLVRRHVTFKRSQFSVFRNAEWFSHRIVLLSFSNSDSDDLKERSRIERRKEKRKKKKHKSHKKHKKNKPEQNEKWVLSFRKPVVPCSSENQEPVLENKVHFDIRWTLWTKWPGHKRKWHKSTGYFDWQIRVFKCLLLKISSSIYFSGKPNSWFIHHQGKSSEKKYVISNQKVPFASTESRIQAILLSKVFTKTTLQSTDLITQFLVWKVVRSRWKNARSTHSGISNSEQERALKWRTQKKLPLICQGKLPNDKLDSALMCSGQKNTFRLFQQLKHNVKIACNTPPRARHKTHLEFTTRQQYCTFKGSQSRGMKPKEKRPAQSTRKYNSKQQSTTDTYVIIHTTSGSGLSLWTSRMTLCEWERRKLITPRKEGKSTKFY